MRDWLRLRLPSSAHSIYVDNVVVKKMSEEEIAQMIPTVTSNGSVKLGEDAEFTLENVKTAWSNAAKSVYVDGKPVEGAEVSGNSAIIPASAFKQTGYYEVVIKAEGFAGYECGVPENIKSRYSGVAGKRGLLSGRYKLDGISVK